MIKEPKKSVQGAKTADPKLQSSSKFDMAALKKIPVDPKSKLAAATTPSKKDPNEKVIVSMVKKTIDLNQGCK